MFNALWKMREGFVTGAGLILVGLLLQYTAGPIDWSAFAFPVNAIVLAFYLLLLVIIYALRHRVRLFSFLFPESPGALAHFLEVLGTRWNITLFHYRTDGADYGRILCAFAAGPDDVELTEHMDRLGYSYNEETADPAFRFFLAR